MSVDEEEEEEDSDKNISSDDNWGSAPRKTTTKIKRTRAPVKYNSGKK